MQVFELFFIAFHFFLVNISNSCYSLTVTVSPLNLFLLIKLVTLDTSYFVTEWVIRVVERLPFDCVYLLGVQLILILNMRSQGSNPTNQPVSFFRLALFTTFHHCISCIFKCDNLLDISFMTVADIFSYRERQVFIGFLVAHRWENC